MFIDMVRASGQELDLLQFLGGDDIEVVWSRLMQQTHGTRGANDHLFKVSSGLNKDAICTAIQIMCQHYI